jgi:pyruvate/2-oxoglutarate dehydrogenase complex dihydrolipoamide acyltransferase (E2) component
MITMRSIGAALVMSLAVMAPLAHSQDGPHEDLAPCPGSAPEPTQSAAWSVAFCNRTGHDIVIEFHDNDCPARNWDRRGDVYQRMFRRGESKTLPLCYASEPQTRKPAPGTPTLRIPGGKGVVTTWNVVGDCGDRSKPLNLDARTFYDRGEYKTGIIVLQYPSGASHCVADASSASASGPAAAAPPVAGAAAGASSSAQTQPGSASPAQPPAQPQAPVATHSPVAAPPAVAAIATPRSSEPPTLTAAVDSKDVVARTVRVLAKGGAGYQCNFTLALTFTDGGAWNDRTKANITAGDADAPIATRKYLKSVSKVEITSSKCTPP